MLNLPMPVSAPLRFLPRGVAGAARLVVEISVSMWSALACEKLSRESCDWVSAVGVSGISSSSDIGEGMRRFRSSSMSCLLLFLDIGACIEGTEAPRLPSCMPPAEPLVGYPSPFIPPLLNVGCIGVGIRPLVLVESELNREELSMAGRMKKLLQAGDSGGWLRISASSSSISML